MNPLPLRNIRVLEMTHVVAGPTAGRILADMGADVIKVEPPDALDPSRPGSARTGSFFYLNSNKRGIVLDLKKDDARNIFYRLAEKADILLENMGPGVMDRLGLGYADLSQRNPRLVYCSIKGFLSGPYGNRPSMDELAQNMSGLAWMTGPKGRPLRAGASVVDIGAASFGVNGILGALLERHTTGKGQFINSGLFETALFYVGQHMAQTQFTGTPPRSMAERDRNTAGGYAVYDLFACSDGRQIFVAVFNTPQWKSFCRVLGLDDLTDNPDLQDNASRARARPWVMPRLDEAIGKHEGKALFRLLSDAAVPAAVVNTPETVMEEAQVQAPHRLAQIAAPGKQLSVPTLPYETSDYVFTQRYDPPARPGRDTKAILAEAGYSPDEIKRLMQAKAAMEL